MQIRNLKNIYPNRPDAVNLASISTKLKFARSTWPFALGVPVATKTCDMQFYSKIL